MCANVDAFWNSTARDWLPMKPPLRESKSSLAYRRCRRRTAPLSAKGNSGTSRTTNNLELVGRFLLRWRHAEMRRTSSKSTGHQLRNGSGVKSQDREGELFGCDRSGITITDPAAAMASRIAQIRASLIFRFVVRILVAHRVLRRKCSTACEMVIGL